MNLVQHISYQEIFCWGSLFKPKAAMLIIKEEEIIAAATIPDSVNTYYEFSTVCNLLTDYFNAWEYLGQIIKKKAIELPDFFRYECFCFDKKGCELVFYRDDDIPALSISSAYEKFIDEIDRDLTREIIPVLQRTHNIFGSTDNDLAVLQAPLCSKYRFGGEER